MGLNSDYVTIFFVVLLLLIAYKIRKSENN